MLGWRARARKSHRDGSVRPLVLTLMVLVLLGAATALGLSAFLTWKAVSLLAEALYYLFGG